MILPFSLTGVLVRIWIPSPTFAVRELTDCSIRSNRWVPDGISAAKAVTARESKNTYFMGPE
jgi:hypothetical protein